MPAQALNLHTFHFWRTLMGNRQLLEDLLVAQVLTLAKTLEVRET